MNNSGKGSRRKLQGAALLMLLAALLLGGCAQIETGREWLTRKTDDLLASPSPTPLRTLITPEPEMTEEPCPVLKGVTTDEKVVSLVLEGFADPETTEMLLGVIKKHHARCTYFVSGVVASEQAETIRAFAHNGVEIGNYGLTGEKRLENLNPRRTAQEYARAQELIKNASQTTPTLARCNGTVLKRHVLQALTAAGIRACVEPTLYINHRSFSAIQDAQTYVGSLVRGSIISLKMGQELDSREFGDNHMALDERPAVDPSPGIADDFGLRTRPATYEGLVNVVDWLLSALEEEGFSLVPVTQLAKYQKNLMGEPRQLDEELERVLDTSAYTRPSLSRDLSSPELHKGAEIDLSGSLVLGGGIVGGLEDYLTFRRTSNTLYLDGIEAVYASGASTEGMLNGTASFETEAGRQTLEELLEERKPRRVYLMCAPQYPNQYSLPVYTENVKVLIYRIRTMMPDIQVVVLSTPPGVKDRISSLSNWQIFDYDLNLAKMCLQYGIPFVDVACALRDADGDLPREYCIDPEGSGTYLSDEGCDIFIRCLIEHVP